MQLAANKYKKSKTLGTWEAPSDEEEKIIALQAELKQLKTQETERSSTYSSWWATQRRCKENEEGYSKLDDNETIER